MLKGENIRAESLEETLRSKRLRAGGEGGNRGWDGWMASPTQWTWVWANSGRWWWTGKPGVLQSMASPKVGHDLATEQQRQSKIKRDSWMSHPFFSQETEPGGFFPSFRSYREQLRNERIGNILESATISWISEWLGVSDCYVPPRFPIF